jgi:hypothetical protein
MIVLFDLTDARHEPTLKEPDDFRSFKLLARGGDREALQRALAGYGSLRPDGDASLDAEEVKRLAGTRGADPGWLESFAAMVDYARQHGWVDGESLLRAHCEWT